MDAATIINRAMQLNPNNWRFWTSRGYLGRPDDWMFIMAQLKKPGVAVWQQLQNPSFLDTAGKILGTCCHGVIKTACFLCSLKGIVLVLSATSIALLVYYYPRQQKASEYTYDNQGYNIQDYALSTLYATGNLCKNSAIFIGKGSFDLAKFSGKVLYDQGPNIWFYGAVMPYSAAKLGLYYSGVGLKKMASTIGYYCGGSEEGPPNEK